MELLLILVASFFITGITCYFWVQGIDYMHKNHPDYKGDDLFGED